MPVDKRTPDSQGSADPPYAAEMASRAELEKRRVEADPSDHSAGQPGTSG